MGDISETPGSHRTICREVGARVAQVASHAIFIGSQVQPYRAGAKPAGMHPESIHEAKSVREATAMLEDVLGEGDVALIKDNIRQRLDRVALSLEGRQVNCELKLCNSGVTRCANCAMLDVGWQGREPAF